MSFIRIFRPILFLLAVGLAAAASAGQPPNILFIMADDMGYGDVQALNPKSNVPTPNLDKLAGQGMTFTDAHSPSAVCTPTRYGVVTGRYCWRTRLKRGVQNGYGSSLINPARETVASFLKKHGYATGVIGKWHLGLDFTKKDGAIDYTQPIKNTPNVNGFEHSYIIPASLDFPPYVYILNDRVTAQPTLKQPKQSFPAYLRDGPRSPDLVMEDVLDHFTEQSVAFIKEKAKGDQPFFLYLPLPAPHKPVLPHKRFVGKSKAGLYGDFVMQVDWTVGEVMKGVDEAGIADNTLVFYTSDNGSFMYRYEDTEKGHTDDPTIQAFKESVHRANGELRGTKADVWEAGHRVPFFVRWPKVVKAGSRSETTITHTDFFATCAEVIGKDLPKDAAEDSFSLLALMKGEEPKSPRAMVINHSASGMFAIRDGRWKLVLGNGSGGREKPKGKPFQKPYALFDLEKDLSEQTNVIDQFPEVAQRLEKECERLRTAGRSRE